MSTKKNGNGNGKKKATKKIEPDDIRDGDAKRADADKPKKRGREADPANAKQRVLAFLHPETAEYIKGTGMPMSTVLREAAEQWVERDKDTK